MAVVQSLYASGFKPYARPQTAYATHSQLFEFSIPGAFAAGDILELAVLPPYSRVVDATIATQGDFGGGTTATVGLMSGTTGELTNDDGSARTSGNELFAAAVIAPLVRMSKSDALFIKSVDGERSIGVKFSAALAASPGRVIALQLSFAQ